MLGPRARGSCKKASFIQFATARLEAALAAERGGPGAPNGGAPERIEAFDNEFRCAVDVADVVQAVRLLLARGWPAGAAGAYNLGGPERLSRADIARAVVAEAAPGRERELVVPTARDPRRFAVASPADISVDSSRLVALTGLRRTPLRETMRRALQTEAQIMGDQYGRTMLIA